MPLTQAEIRAILETATYFRNGVEWGTVADGL